MTIIPVGDYRPDAPAYLGTHATVATNVYPRPDGSDGPLQAAASAATGLSFQPTTAFVARDGEGSVFLYVGVAGSPYVFRKYSTTFQNYLTSLTSGSPSVRAPWRFCQFGTRLMATCQGLGLWWQHVGSMDNFTEVTAAPRATFIATVEPGFVVLGNIVDTTTRPAGLRWSAINDGTDFPVVGTSDAASKQSDDQDLPQGGQIMGIVPAVGGAAAAVFTERSIYRMEYVGAPAVFAFREQIRGQGNICPNAAIAVNGVAYFISEDGFQRFDGQSVTPIGLGRVSRLFLDNVKREALHMVSVAHDPNKKIIVWAYPGPDSDANNYRANLWLIYSYATDRWRYSDDPEIECYFVIPTAAVDHIPLEFLDTLYPSGPDSMGDISYDGGTIAGGTPLLAGFNENYAYVTWTGAALAALVETGETDSGGRRVLVTGIRPLTDAAAPTASVGHRANFNASVTYTTLTAQGADAICPQRIAARYARARIYIPAAASWTYLQGADVLLRAEGKR